MRAGQPYDAFWGYTPREVHLILTAVSERDQDEHRLRRSIAYETATLVSVGIGNPKKFPKPDEFLSEKKKRRTLDTLAEQRAFLSRFAKRKAVNV